MNIRSKLEADLRAQARTIGVDFTRLELASAANELGLLEMIELNHPSKEVVEVMTVAYPNPKNNGEIIEGTVERKTRVLMTDEEVSAYYDQLAIDRLLEKYADDPAGLAAVLGKTRKQASPRKTKPTGKPVKPKQPIKAKK